MNRKTSPAKNDVVINNADLDKTKHVTTAEVNTKSETQLNKDHNNNNDDNAKNKKDDDGGANASVLIQGDSINNIKTFPLHRYMPRFVTPAERLAQRSAFVVEGVIENLRIVHACLADDLLARHEREEWVLRKKRRAQEKKSRRALEAARKALFRRNKNNNEGGDENGTGALNAVDDGQRSNKSKTIGSVSQTSKSTQQKKTGDDNDNNNNNNDGDMNTNHDTCGYNTNKPEKNKSLPLVVINNSGPLVRSTADGGVVLASAINMIKPKNKHQDIQIQVPRLSSSSAKPLFQFSSGANLNNANGNNYNTSNNNNNNNNNNNDNNQNTAVASNATIFSVYGTTTNPTDQRTSPSASQQHRSLQQHASAAEASTSTNPNNNNNNNNNKHMKINNNDINNNEVLNASIANGLINPDASICAIPPPPHPVAYISERKEISSSAFDALSKLFSEISYHHNIDTQEKEEIKSMIGLRSELKIFEEHQKELDRRSKKKTKDHQDQLMRNDGNDDDHSQQEPIPEGQASRLAFASSLLSNAKHLRLHPLHPPLSELVKSISHNPAAHIKTVRDLKEHHQSLLHDDDAEAKKVIHHYASRLYDEDNPFAGRFRILKQLGAGTFGAVFLCGWDSGAADFEAREHERAEKENDPEAIQKQKEAFVSEKQAIAKKQELVDEFERNTTEALAKQLQQKQRTLSLDRNHNSNTSFKDNETELQQQLQAPIYITPPRRASLEGSSGGSNRNLLGAASRLKSVVIAGKSQNNNNVPPGTNNQNSTLDSGNPNNNNNNNIKNDNNDDNSNRGKVMYSINNNDAVVGSCTLPPPSHATQQQLQQQQESELVRIVTIRANRRNDSSLHERVLVGEEEDDLSTSGSVAMVNQDNADDDDDDDDDVDSDKKGSPLKNDDESENAQTQRSDGVVADFTAAINSQPLHVEEKKNNNNTNTNNNTGEFERNKNPMTIANSSSAAGADAKNPLAAAFDRHQQQMRLMRARKANLLRHCLNPSGGVSTLASTKPFIVVTGLPIDTAAANESSHQPNINNNATNNTNNSNNHPCAPAVPPETGSKKYCREDIFVCKVELLDVGLLREDEYLNKEARRVGFLNSRLVPRRIPKSIFSQEALNNFMRKNPSGYEKQLKEQQKAMELREKKLAGEGGVTADEDLALEQIDDENRFLGDKRRQGLAHVVGLEYANRMKREAHILQNLAHPNIISYIDCFQNDGKQFLFLEYVDGGDFEKEIAKKRDANQCWNEESSLFFFVQIVLAVEYLHRHNILHRDLKLANILISKNLFLKVSDFGTAEQFNFAFWDTNEAIAKVAAGTPLTAAPELFQGQAYSEKADMYSLGVILYCILDPSGYPHYATDVPTLRQSVLTKPYRPVTRQLTDPVRNILHALLRKDPERRPTALQLLQTRPMQAAFTQYRRRVEKFVNLQAKPSHPTALTSFAVSPTTPHRPPPIPRGETNGSSFPSLVGSIGSISNTNKTPVQPNLPTSRAAHVAPTASPVPVPVASTSGLDIDSLWLQVLEDQFELLQEFARQERRRLKLLLKQKRQELKLKLKQQKLQFQEGTDGTVVSAGASSVASSGISGDYGFQSKTNDRSADDDDDENDDNEDDDDNEAHANDDDDDDGGSARSESSVSTSSQHSRREVERHRIKVAQKRAERAGAVAASTSPVNHSAGGLRRRAARAPSSRSRSPSNSSSKSSVGSHQSREGIAKSGLGGVVGVATSNDSNRKGPGIVATTTVQMMKEAVRMSKK